ncbi:MAG: DUF4058 family protein [Synechococcales cyanobacterium CRU_2_2]|nr:DUF4058 family protein [Synechococcales cyanobacterium CRU_2_2]
MASPFPGMDPYLEHPQTWSNVHHRLITAIAIALAPQVRPKYRVVVEEATYQTEGRDSPLIGMPDVAVARGRGNASIPEGNIALQTPLTQPISVRLPIPSIIQQGYLEIREIANDAVITVLEVLSPINKRRGKGRKDYLLKRETVLTSSTHWVEIDLLRQWEPMPIIASADIVSDYRILVSASEQRPRAELYAFNIQDPIPVVSLPLAPQEPMPTLDFNGLMAQIYEQSGYDLVLDYRQDPKPQLSEANLRWLDQWLRGKGLR